MDNPVPFASGEYFIMLTILAFARGTDFFSTWLATPRLILEGNPFAKWLGWRGAIGLNIVMVPLLAKWPSTAIAMSTMSVLVAGRNFQSAWIMRTMGEEAYRDWYVQRLTEARRGLHLLCVAGETLLAAAVGAALVIYSSTEEYWLLVPSSIGVGVIAYAVVVAFFTLLSVWRSRRRRVKTGG